MDINNSNENKQDNTNNQKTLNSSIKDEKSSENVKTESKPIKKKSRMYLVLLFLALTAVVMYVIYRGNYLEILELGENYLPIFWRNIAYMSITFIVNFLVLFILIYLFYYFLLLDFQFLLSLELLELISFDLIFL